MLGIVKRMVIMDFIEITQKLSGLITLASIVYAGYSLKYNSKLRILDRVKTFPFSTLLVSILIGIEIILSSKPLNCVGVFGIPRTWTKSIN